jgi:N-acetylmuramoyl-L-alanine amidase
MIYHTYRGKKYPVKEVVLHTAATPARWAKNRTINNIVEEIDKWHKARELRGIGYHRVIAPNGDVGVGRSLWDTGEHASGHNVGTVGICLIPSVRDHAGIAEFDTYFTEAQRTSLKNYLAELQKYTTIEKVSGHNEYSSKDCPGFLVKTSDWI